MVCIGKSKALDNSSSDKNYKKEAERKNMEHGGQSTTIKKIDEFLVIYEFPQEKRGEEQASQEIKDILFGMLKEYLTKML